MLLNWSVKGVMLFYLCSAFPRQPLAPPVNASPEDIMKYMNAVRHYLNLITRQRYGRHSKLDDQVRRGLIRESTKRLMETLKELHAFVAKTSQALHKSGLYGRVARRKPLRKKSPP
uniref:Uncharacterized protein n=1 Tax=Eptatretus burgeri TaxID=7764 RepID=A0A8C4WVD0_EPTBU